MTHLLITIKDIEKIKANASHDKNMLFVIDTIEYTAKQISLDEKNIEDKAEKAFSNYRKDKFGLSRVTRQIEGYTQALKDLL